MIIPKNLLDRMEEGAVYILLAYYMRPNVPGPIGKIWALLGFLIIPLLIFRKWKGFAYVATRDFLPILMVLLALLSASWSINSTATLAYGRALVASTAFGIYFATRYSLKEQLNIIFRIILVFTILSFLAGLLVPSYGTSFVRGGVWQGIYRHKNELSGAMALATSSFLVVALYGLKKQRSAALLGALLGFFLLLSSEGKGSLAIFSGSLFLLPLHKMVKQEYRLRVVTFIVFLLTLSLVSISTIVNLEFIVVDLLGKSLALNSRQPLWTLLIDLGMQKPWLGFGYGGFWIDPSNAQAVAVEFPWISGVGTGGGNAHNGYVELFIQLGFLGLIPVIAHVLMTLSRSVFLFGMKKDLENLWFLLLLFNIMSTSFYESYASFLAYRHWFWVLYISGSYSTLMEVRKLVKTDQSYPEPLLKPGACID
ncbi:MAG: O-antigen ligase family protein [Cyanobacteria bacterium P01_F01_bin.86]